MVFRGILEVDDQGFITGVQQASETLDDTEKKAEKVSQDVDDHVQVSYFKLRCVANSAYGVINDLFDCMGISLGALGPVIESAIQVAVAIVSIATAETGASHGAMAFNLVMAAISLGLAIASMTKQDQAKKQFETARDAVHLVNLVSTL